MKQINEFLILTVSEKPGGALEQAWLFPEPLEMYKGHEDCWDEQTCPHCGVKGKLDFLRSYETSPYIHNVSWLDHANEYLCKACRRYIFYNQRQRVLYRSGYYGLSASLVGPSKDNWVKPNSSIAGVPHYWDGNTCEVCGGKNLEAIGGSFDGCCTGKTSGFTTMYCPDCRMFLFAYEYDD